jgi:Tol biopolymer transport system component
MNPSRRSPPAVLIIGAGILIGITLILMVAMPRVDFFSPAPGSANVSSLSRISIRFNRPMAPLSVESRMRIDPEQSGKYYWDGQTLFFEPDEPWPSGSSVEVTLPGGSKGLNGLPMIGERRWRFDVGLPSLVYLWPGEGKSDVFRWPLDAADEPIQLTESETGVLDYSISLDGTLLIYVADRLSGGTEVHALDLIAMDDRLLFSCDPELPCSAPAISPDGEWVAFERVAYQMGAADRLVASGTSIWITATSSDGEPILVSPPDHSAVNPEWSPTGWLIYYDDHLRALALLNPVESQDPAPFNYIPTGLGILGSWSPDGTRLVYPDIIFPDQETVDQNASGEDNPLYYSHIYMVDVTDGRTADISPGGDWMVEDASPSVSPDGRWVAFTRKFLDAERWSLGRQVWLMNSERTELRVLTDEPGATFSSLSWSPDSRRLAFMRKPIADLAQPAEIGWVDVTTGELLMIVQGGFLPGWLP